MERSREGGRERELGRWESAISCSVRRYILSVTHIIRDHVLFSSLRLLIQKLLHSSSVIERVGDSLFNESLVKYNQYSNEFTKGQ